MVYRKWNIIYTQIVLVEGNNKKLEWWTQTIENHTTMKHPVHQIYIKKNISNINIRQKYICYVLKQIQLSLHAINIWTTICNTSTHRW